MAGLIVVIIGMCCVIAFMGWKMRCLKRDIYSFENLLERHLDDMASGRDLPDSDVDRDTLWSKVYEELQRVQHIWKQKDREGTEEKRKIQELISDISHQTKTPIANMKMYLELFAAERNLLEKEREFLTRITGQTEKLDFLLQSMVKMSRLETGIIKICQRKDYLLETLGGAVAAVVPKAEKKQIRIYVSCDESVQICHDRKWTEEAIFNILDNAVKYTYTGGCIRISVDIQEIFTKISIRDSGKGIALERQAEIFTRFYREPEVHSEEGIGVGLYLAREILTLQKGYIQVYSEAGKGSDFQIYLPNG
ncbi:HAMP domain-containing histidine kinase [Ruminococcus sp. OA3]|uniref:sensor histidine kinase n=1 Tax=Ruminococcus sp. OA3 TaxID=2914164 RepID=UPI001F051CA9|nr:HAMP domain-containing sensor histidine kinase [Ruminococcus sp. OA3]MCH1983729.1 HAMP domain-containing histidine kinase [Ruminococcus sp. OA3]